MLKKRKSLKKVLLLIFTGIFFSCGTTSSIKNPPAENSDIKNSELGESENFSANSGQNESEEVLDSDRIELLFAGDIMAHSVNYNISTYEKIWHDVKNQISKADLAFANIEAPVDTKKSASSYPNFNMTKKYVKASVEAGFDVFSLCNNHTNDQYLEGIKETGITMKEIAQEAAEENHQIYFSGLKDGENAQFTFNVIEKKGWKILFLPVTELLNRPDYSSYINFIRTDEKSRKNFIEYLKKLREENPCDLFILSLHTSEVEYTRAVTERQENFYNQILDSGVDILWANHAHIIKNRKIIIRENASDKIVMYACGNTISGQRTKPDFSAKNPTSERDNTGDGLFYKVFLKKNDDGNVKLEKAEPFFITTYINTANEYVIKPLNQEFVDYLYSVPRLDWARYIEKRIKINYSETKDYIEWQ